LKVKKNRKIAEAGRGTMAPPFGKKVQVLKGWRFGLFVGAVVGGIGVAIYPIIISPFYHQEEWQKVSKANRTAGEIRQESIQPGNMKVWTDPFDRPGKEGK